VLVWLTFANLPALRCRKRVTYIGKRDRPSATGGVSISRLVTSFVVTKKIAKPSATLLCLLDSTIASFLACLRLLYGAKGDIRSAIKLPVVIVVECAWPISHQRVPSLLRTSHLEQLHSNSLLLAATFPRPTLSARFSASSLPVVSSLPMRQA
jgi:hypothetical protein